LSGNIYGIRRRLSGKISDENELELDQVQDGSRQAADQEDCDDDEEDSALENLFGLK
jgi:hypothetical protein